MNVFLDVMRSLMLPLTLAILLSITGRDAVAAEEERPKAKVIKFDPSFAKPGFASVEAFVESVNMRQGIWGALLLPDRVPENDGPENLHLPLSESVSDAGVTIVHQSRNSALVFARNKHFRTSPFCAVVFLLSKSGQKFHVVDFVRRSVGYGSYSDMSEPKVLKLPPDGSLHFYFTEYLGGRRWGFDTDEFFMVRNQKFRRTLVLKNVSAFLSPAAPFREFTQSADVSAVRGQLRITVKRDWGMEDGENREETFSVFFRWNPRTKTFSSRDIGRITLREPEFWTGKGLPKPPIKTHPSPPDRPG